jgi:hypothetical protein
MRLHLLLPKVDPKALPVPAKCVYPDCKSLQVRLHPPGVSQAASVPIGSKGWPCCCICWDESYGAVSLALDRVASRALQDGGLRDGASRRRTRPRTQARASLGGESKPKPWVGT